MIQIALAEPGRFGVADIAEPAPQADEALVRIHRIGVCGTDLHAFAGRQPFFHYPRVLGHELGVEVVDPGSGHAGLKRGNRCSVEPYLNCGRCIACRRGKPNCCTELRVLGVHIDGGMQPYLAVPARKLHVSARLDFDQLALIETLAIGAHAVERAEMSRDDFVVVVGAGPIGLSAIQFAQLTGARLAVMDVSERRLQLCREHLKATQTLLAGPKAADDLRRLGGGDLPTVVIDATGNQASMARAFDLTASGGRIVFVGIYNGDIAFNDPNLHRRELTVCASRNALPATFQQIIALVEAGTIDTRPWITHRLELAQVPAVFPRDIAGNPAVLKAMISVV
ncbi:MAG: hypothetical protein RIQ93_1088 [Verrucomicrobiota bacterium]|jgi:2-desacetyl-2-hydroxyethyl bacteriochlorophyllide A dehydrogenase